MTTHVLIACSKSKSVPSEPNLQWKHDSTIDSWKEDWNSQEFIQQPSELYTGRPFKQQYELIKGKNDTLVYVISAGAGLICPGTKVPSYDATFIRDKGPRTDEWHHLPEGGIIGMKLSKGDSVVSFAPPNYHKALLQDPNLELISDILTVASTSPLASKARTVLNIHSRSKEVLKVSSTDLNTKFLEIFLNDGVEGFNSLYEKAKSLPPIVDRKPVSDEELHSIVKKIKNITSNSALVRHLRDDLLIKASVERINAARKKVIQDSQDD